MKPVLVIIIFNLMLSAQAQQVQWAHKLIKFSSDLGGKQNGIKRILGKPDALPQCGNSPNGWSPKNALDGREVVVVGFEKPQSVKQIAIFENLNAGCVYRVFVSTDGEKFEAVWGRKSDYKTPVYKTTLTTDRSYYFGRKRRKIQEVPQAVNPGIERIILEAPMSNITMVKVEFVFALVPGQKQIDAIGISDSENPIEAKINSKPELENLDSPVVISLGNLQPSGPVVSPDGKLYFSVTNQKEQIYATTYLGNDKWDSATILPEFSQNENYNYLEVINENFALSGGAIYDKGTGDSGYTVFKNNNGTYEKQGQLKIAAFNNYNDTSDATMTSDGKTLILAIETDFTQGSLDLYYAHRKEDGTYGFLQNMGKVINSAAEESNPQLLSDSKTLLFASNGFSSNGNYDLFVSYRLDDSWKNWSEPINLGSKINTIHFDGQPFYDEKNEKLYYVTSVDEILQMKAVPLPKKHLR
ncbi:hypothetical protein EQG63_00725 [Flavobacterium amnicola]|uniref:F5/8 type C domain-containing protein n=1 Tax=Flavobacterium amnicola TaxID=2506422 RepID=A0A4Q1K4J7_9FLAO|nr:PD40 domain-containing protein [Flavobacterium amnicola]RXR20487.1 hypothetical protein EQG63_00725 [Flavobacterium amnicola]